MTLEQMRHDLDEIDSLLVSTLGKRFQICRAIAKVKQQTAIPMMQSDRVRVVHQRVAALAESNEIATPFISNLYELIIGEACRIEQQIMDDDSSRSG